MNKEKDRVNIEKDSRRNKKLSAREVALEILTRVAEDQAYSNLLLNQTLERYKLERLDASLVTEIVYGTIQRNNTIDHFLQRFVNKGLEKLQPWVSSLLRLSFYQLYYLDRIPPHAVVHEAVEIAKKKGHRGISGLVNGVLRNVLRSREELTIPDNLPPVKRIALQHSHPEWMVSKWIKQYGERTAEQICASNNEPPKSSIRVNTLKLERTALLERLRNQGLQAEASEIAASGIVARSGGNLALAEGYAAGEFSIQDESSMLVSEITDPQPGMQVLDCCAAPGGKTTHLAEKMHDMGTIWANDVHEHKKKLIEAQAGRLGLNCIRTQVTDAAHLSERFAEGSFDRILLDAPCSGLGVIRRKPDVKWSKSEREIAGITDIQFSILSDIRNLLKPGGVLVYSTCTLMREENEGMIARFLEQFPEFEPDPELEAMLPEPVREKAMLSAGMVRILPHHFHSDGFFIARLKRKSPDG
ncbi:16S rRNA (cytosine(967)-C(5))-methyltransferase RsmB [Ferviditalea candida]|uniref:16S rRNA (cytosine(967)-C(5))-methyltransferase n=1 Tax=Ferviditalea candida TaxID=3108399 RepID=A0ABU5ZGB2_9BACL|nr:16S rRNA (cytosine(967)-C(5))-methyltransferase RsmB [Paenibacillaceae bacterium T2]